MIRTFIQTKEFTKNWDDLGLSDNELRKLELELLVDPSGYPVIQGTGGLRKMRLSLENTGKRGGVRVCYVDFVVEEVIYLITVYSKNKKDNLSKTECSNIKKAIEALRASLKEMKA